MANRYLVAYDLHYSSRTEYSEVEAAIERCGDSVRLQESVWLVASTMDKKSICEEVERVAGPHDKIFVALFSGTYRVNHSSDVADWLKRNPVE